MRHRPIFIVYFLLLPFLGLSQVTINKPIIMVGDSASDRLIRDIGNPTDSLDAVSAGIFQSGILNYSQSTGINDLNLTLTPTPNDYQEGMTIHFLASSANTGNVTINVNSLGIKPLFNTDNTQLSPGIIKNGQIISMIYSAGNFYLISRTDPECPQGFIDVNSQFCIEQTDRTAVLYYNAANTCHNLGYRLCTWSEWYYSCQKASLGLSNMINNWEWIDDTSDHAHTVLTVGNSSCFANLAVTVYQSTAARRYRCCFSK